MKIIVMVTRLSSLALLATRGRWLAVAIAAAACVVVAFIGGTMLL